jgi:hypothetical protein
MSFEHKAVPTLDRFCSLQSKFPSESIFLFDAFFSIADIQLRWQLHDSCLLLVHHSLRICSTIKKRLLIRLLMMNEAQAYRFDKESWT